MKYNQKITKPILYTLLVLGIFGFSKFPESCAKYATYDETALALNAGQYTLEKNSDVLNISIDYDNSELTTPAFILSFDRNTDIGTFKQDKYTLNLPSSCVVDSIQANKKPTTNKTNKTVIYNHTDEDKVVVKMHCTNINNVISGTGDNRRFNVQVSIEEQITSLSNYVEKSFTYTASTYMNTTYSEYASHFKIVQPTEPNKKTIRKGDTEAYTIFENWLKAYYANDTTNQRKVLDYVQTYCKTTDEFFQLAGLDVEYDGVTDSYTYTIGSNFTKYADLYENETGDFEYFLPADDKELENAFEFYLKNDIYKNDPESVELIISYVKSISKDGRGIGAMILPDKDDNTVQEIPGFVIDENKPQAITVTEDILDYVFNFTNENKIIRIPFRDPVDMITLFIKSLSMVYEDSEISAELIEEIQSTYKNIGILQAVYKNYDGTTPKAFNNYFIIYDDSIKNQRNVVIRVYSNVSTDGNGIITEPYNYAEILTIDSADIPGGKTVRISTKKEDKQKLLDIIDELDTKYNTKTTVADSSIIEDTTTGIIVYDYKIPKTLSTPDSTTNQTQPGIMDDAIVSEITTKPNNSTSTGTSSKPTTDTTVQGGKKDDEKVEDDTPVTDTPNKPEESVTPTPTEEPTDGET